MSNTRMIDAQAALGFVVSQRSHIETEVLKKPYPAIRYAEMIPVDTLANPFAASVTHFAQDAVGQAKFVNGKGDDVPLVNIKGSKFEQGVNMAGVGYSFSLEEIGAAQQLGQNLSSDGAEAARMAYEQLVNSVAFIGDNTLGVEGLYNTTGIAAVAASKAVSAMTPQETLAMINDALTAIVTNTLGIEVPDTVCLPLAIHSLIATKQIDATSSMTILEFIQKANVYTARTGQPLTIIGDHQLTDKMVVYRRDPQVLKMHMPMPLQFIAPQYVNFEVKVLGMFRFAPVNIRRPKAVRYVTGLNG